MRLFIPFAFRCSRTSADAGGERSIGRRDRGSGILELVLFIPLGLLFLFAAVDCGLALADRASVRSALRQGLHSQIMQTRDQNVIVANAEAALEIDEQAVKQALNSVAEWVFASIAETRRTEEAKLLNSVSIEVAAVRLTIDEQRGTAVGFEILTGRAEPSLRGAFDIQAVEPAYSYRSRDTFINQLLRPDEVSPFAVRHSAHGFQPFALAIYGEVTCSARGINPLPVQSLLSHYFVIQEQLLFPLRGGVS